MTDEEEKVTDEEGKREEMMENKWNIGRDIASKSNQTAREGSGAMEKEIKEGTRGRKIKL